MNNIKFCIVMGIEFLLIGVTCFLIRKDNPMSIWLVWVGFGLIGLLFLVSGIIDLINERNIK